MKKYLLFLFQLFISGPHLNAQAADDVYHKRDHNQPKPGRNKSEKEPAVSEFGHYFSFGAGAALILPMAGGGLNGSYSFAYKSHLLSVSGMAAGTLLNGGGDYESWFTYSSYGLLAGEALRSRHWLLSASAGVGYSYAKYRKVIHAYHEDFSYRHKGISMPAEIKLFFLASHFGIGFQISTDLTAKYAPAMITANLVFGTWRKPKE